MGLVIYDFEGLDDTLPYVPIAARRLLDLGGKKLSLAGWQSLRSEDRWQLARAGAGERVGLDAVAILDRATPAPTSVSPTADPSAVRPPAELVNALGAARPLDQARWQGLSALDRYTLVKSSGKAEKLARAYDGIVRPVSFSHLSAAGAAHMVDVGGKDTTARRAVASARVRTTPEVVGAIVGGHAAKGDVLGAARVAGILAAKRTPELIPLCHPVQTTQASIDFAPDADNGQIRVTATVEALDRTGVEMEALVGAAIASLTIYDMIKSADRWATIEAIQLESKSGGKSGELSRPPDGDDP
jgi:cyclic pyranopterin monophosphate synthase